MFYSELSLQQSPQSLRKAITKWRRPLLHDESYTSRLMTHMACDATTSPEFWQIYPFRLSGSSKFTAIIIDVRTPPAPQLQSRIEMSVMICCKLISRTSELGIGMRNVTYAKTRTYTQKPRIRNVVLECPYTGI